jgi:hypothetical protein
MHPSTNTILRALKAISQVPATNPGDWLSSAESSIEFLKANVQSDRLVLFASMPCLLIHSVLGPLKNLNPPNRDDLTHDFVMPNAAWAIEHSWGGGQPDQVYLSPPLGRHGKSLAGGEKLFFNRSLVGSEKHPIEISQKLVHALDLHYIEERNAYCRLDDDGDLEDVISIVEQRDEGGVEDITLVTISAKEFWEYARLSRMGMVIFFDFTRVIFGSFSGWNGQKRFDHKARDLFYDGGVSPGHASYVNGRMVVRPPITLAQIVRARKEARDPLSRQYAVFKAINLRDGEQIEVSCNPKGLSNYFQPDSSLPLEMSPAFFNAEVLHRYKADSEKYQLHERRIYCRGTWSLQTYDINEAGQVHTYLRYLGQLPYKEQLYWLVFNEWPKAPISRRAWTTDFQGEVFTEYDSLNSLKYKIRELDKSPPSWWQPRGEKLLNAVRYPATSAANEWANEILGLDQLIVEGFQTKGLRAFAQRLGRAIQPEWQSLKLLEECLVGSGVEHEAARSAMSALRTLHEHRTAVKGHASNRRNDLQKRALATFGTFRSHFVSLAEGVDKTMEIVIVKLGAID